MKRVTKRDGRRVNFNKFKIETAILKAFDSIDHGLSDYSHIKASQIAQNIEDIARTKSFNVEEIQDLVEESLMASKRKDVAKAFILYREQRNRYREKNSDIVKEVVTKLLASDVQNQNANVDEKSFGGKKGEASNALMKHMTIEYRLSDLSKYNHLNNRIYIHDMDSYEVGMHNCLSIPFDDLFKNGFKTRQADVRPPKSINTAFQLLAVIFQIQSLQQFGGVSATHLDWTMVPFVRKSFQKHYIVSYLKSNPLFTGLNLMDMLFDNYEEKIDTGLVITRNKFEDWVDEHKALFYSESGLTEDDFTLSNKDNLDPVLYQSALYDTIVETMQAVEGMYHNLNTLQSRSGNQLPFTSINYGTCTLPEGRLVIKCLLEASIKGTGKFRKTSIFPCGIFQLMRDVNRNPGDPNYDLYKLAIKSTSQRLYPNYANVDWSGNVGYDRSDPRTYFSTMGCRTANGYDINGFGQLKDGRGNICPVTIIMPTLAMEAKEFVENKFNSSVSNDQYVEQFIEILDKAIYDAKDMLIERFDWICQQSPDSADFMYKNNTMAGYVPEEGIRSALRHGTLAIGQIGLAETLQILIGKNHTTEEGMIAAKKIEQLFKDRCAEFKEKYRLNFGVYYTPAENLCYTSMNKFKKKYGIIKNVSDRDYFTNSIHVPVWEDVSPFDKIDIESQLTGYSSAGCITYVEFDSMAKHNLDALETVINYAMDKDIPYFAINVPCDTCEDCGYQDEFSDCCPVCGSRNIQQLRRVTGYLTGNYKTAFNPGKQKEVEDRYKHSKRIRDSLKF